MSSKPWKTLIAAAVLLAAVWAVFFGATWSEFLSWDDDINITGNPHVRGLTSENLRWMFTDTEYVRRYMPVGWLGWACQYQWFGENSAGYHFGNILFHSLSAVLLMLVLRRLLLLTLPAESREGSAPVALICAGMAALLWAIHPLRVEPVAWASGRLYCQAILFLLGSMLAYLRYYESRAAGRPSRIWFWGSVAAYGGSLLTYPLALAFVAVLPLVDLYPLRRFQLSLAGLRSAGARQVFLEKIPYVMVVGLVFALTLWARAGASGMWNPPATLAEFGLLDRVMQGFYVWASYLWATIAPRDLSPVYTSLVQFDPLAIPFLASAFLVAGISALVAWKSRRWPGAAVGWACYLLILVPMLGLTEHPHYVNDRYSYLPALALAALVAGGLFKLWQQRGARIPALALTCGAALLCGLLTTTQVRAWRDTDTLFLHMISKMGDSPYRADTYCRLGNRRLAQGRWQEAQGYFSDATRVAPAFVPGYCGLGEALSRQGRGQEAASVFVTALNVRPPTADLRVRAAEALAGIGRYREALEQFRAALERTPGYGQAMNGMAWLLATCPDEKLRDGASAVALAVKIAEGTDHRVAIVETTLAAAYAEAGDFGKATAAAQTASTLAASAGDTNGIARASAVLESVRQGSAYRERPPTSGSR